MAGPKRRSPLREDDKQKAFAAGQLDSGTVEKAKTTSWQHDLKRSTTTRSSRPIARELGITNAMAIPKLEKIVIQHGAWGEATQNVKIMDPLVADLASIAGQKPVTTKAKKSIAAFKVREGMPIGAMVTLRGDTMYEFLDRLISIALPRVRDFKGVSSKSFDGRGNYTLGLRDQLIFAEIDYAKVDKLKGHERHHRDDCQGRQRRADVAEGVRYALPCCLGLFVGSTRIPHLKIEMWAPRFGR